jgi:co-chaperonin GroES (HSP10)
MPSSVAKVYGAQFDEARLGELAKYVKPMWADVVVLPAEDPSKIKVGGVELAVPEAAKNPHPTEGVVVATGPDVPLTPRLGADGAPEKDQAGEDVLEPVFLPGDRVVFSRYTGMKLIFSDQLTLLLVPASDIRGIMDPDCPALGQDKPQSFVPR